MENLNLHAWGNDAHLKTLKERYEVLKKQIMSNIRLNKVEKASQLKAIKKVYDKSKADTTGNLYKPVQKKREAKASRFLIYTEIKLVS